MDVKDLVSNIGDNHSVGPCEKRPDGVVFVSKSNQFKNDMGQLVCNTAISINHDRDIEKHRKAKFGLTGKQYRRMDKAIKRAQKVGE